MQKTRAWLKRLVFTGQLTLIGMMMFGVLKYFLNAIRANIPITAKYLNTVLNKQVNLLSDNHYEHHPAIATTQV